MPVDEKFKLDVLSLVRGIGEKFDEPDDDWMPVLIAGEIVVPLNFTDETAKDLMAELVMPIAIRESKAKEYAFVSSTWVSTITPPEEMRDKSTEEQMRYIGEHYPPPSMSDQRKESVVVSFGSCDGTNEMWMAEIKRSEDKPPELSEWEYHGSNDYEGRFVEPLMKAIKENG